MKIPVHDRHFQSNVSLQDENSSGRQPAYEFDNSPGRASWTPAPGDGGPEPRGEG
jgi:hypothetical protein